MKFNNILTLLLAFTFVTTATFAVATPAYADCSYNGYYNSGGTCAKSFKKNQKYNYQSQNQYQERVIYGFNDQAIQALILRLQEMIRILEARLGDTSSNSTASVTTRTATDIEDDRATLNGRLFMGNEDEAEVYFEYGTSRTSLDEDTSSEYFDDDEDAYLFSEEVRNLDDNTTYYYRAVSEDDDGDKDYGSILTFRTDSTSSSNLDLPDIETLSENNVTDDEAELRGEVDMNDYRNGIVFFVYGEDESMIEDVADDFDTYAEIEEQGDDLQKVRVDSDLDNSSIYQETVSDLDADTRIYYSVCVEFEDDNDDRIMCGDTESFVTEND